MNIMNTGLTTQNALSQGNNANLKIMQARIKSMQNKSSSTTTPKFVDGHRVIAPDSKKIDKKLMKVCKDFESIFVNQLFKVMRNTLNKKNNILHGGKGEEMFKDMLYQKYSKQVATAGDFGFGKMLYDKLTTINRGYK